MEKKPRYLMAKKTIEIDEHDALVVRHALAQRLKAVQAELSILSIARERDLTKEERWMLPANLQELTWEYLRDQIDPWEYYRNKEYVKGKVRERLGALKEWFEEYKSTLKCNRCPENHPAALDFHHKDGKKELNVGKAVQAGWHKDRILAEIAKCEVLCANCHRKEHWKQWKQCKSP